MTDPGKLSSTDGETYSDGSQEISYDQQTDEQIVIHYDE